MSLSAQRLDASRYSLIPRTLCFLVKDDRILLLRLGEDKGEWAGLLNGIGGHVERGESPLRSCQREVTEETGLLPSRLRLCGVATIDASEDVGIGLYIFAGNVDAGPIRPTAEGTPVWCSLGELARLDTVPDLPLILPRALDCFHGRADPFVAQLTYRTDGNPELEFS